ncbi:uncharacterized protein SPPG_08528 [Spizellomyces punctatus DAOM BR117]|uniref:Piwi domain-containing protein n=1 Tax=Spizellomyces punctatus (strain DAOM BR117) TaxID=645134 RepID=A0A0L0H3U1_SPIPD|nr:uncharacterized protein SPPG_08528 [Spizellomyces punctatus DAOM BR117]KNC96140.1 hypothetical protein SPPG_08528 [Spizellomyces punctatus DAOM BR117]|eukprot:XP_016604180.1 hypothetical protein SPPG_08528 [Spizellomyces punctatus DAOM BR117]
MATPKLTELPLRPDAGGTIGRPIKVRCNIFPLRMVANTIAYQYDVVMTPEKQADKISASLAKRAWRAAEEQFRAGDKAALVVYDGKKNAFSTANLEQQSVKVVVNEDEEEYYPPMEETLSAGAGRGGRGGGRGGRGGRGDFRGGRGGGRGGASQTAPTVRPVSVGPARTKTVNIRIKQTAKIDFHSLALFMTKKGPETDHVLHAVTALSSVLRHIPCMSFVAVGSNFYTPEDRTHISGGLEIWRGYHQSIRAMMAGHLGINVDVAATVFRRGEVPFLDIVAEVLNVRDVAELTRIPILSLRARMSSEFKDAVVVTTHRGDLKQRFKIGSISRQSADEYTFDVDGRKMSIAEYFLKQYNLRLKYPKLPVVVKSNGKSAFPMEFLKMAPSVRFKNRLNGDQTSQMIRATVQRPLDREKRIASAVTTALRYNNNPYMKAFGISVDPSPMTIKARVLPAPDVVFGRNQRAKGTEGSWRLGKALAKPSTIASYGFVFFSRMQDSEAYQVKKQLISTFQSVGIIFKSNAECPIRIQNPEQSQNVRKALHAVATEATAVFKSRCQIIFCIIPRGRKIDGNALTLYDEIKRITLTEMDVLSQCMADDKARLDRLNNKYAENVALKVNVKMGGATNFVDRLPLFEDKPTLICGADVTHAAPGSGAPSVAAVVTSLDKQATRYRTFLAAQPSRLEIIQDMEKIMGDAVESFKKAIGTFPQRLIFFRDGVSSGQFKEVREKEVSAIKRALANLKLGAVPVTFIIVQKRHHIRFFPNDNNQDKSGNCLPGTTVDTDIMHPTEYNFVLQSHAGLQGTSRPTIYHVIHDEIKMSSNVLQQLCFNLCFLSERATRSINMVAPAYRAHLAAYYGRMFLEGDFDTASSRSGNSEPTITLRKVMPLMDQHTMYYM